MRDVNFIQTFVLERERETGANENCKTRMKLKMPEFRNCEQRPGQAGLFLGIDAQLLKLYARSGKPILID